MTSIPLVVAPSAVSRYVHTSVFCMRPPLSVCTSPVPRRPAAKLGARAERAPEHNQPPTLADPEAILNEPWIGRASIRRLSSKRFVNEVQHQMRRRPCGRLNEHCKLPALMAR